jgi:hypothetical protein
MPNETILILDNESHSRWTLKALLESEHYLVVAVDTIERALRNFSEFEISGFITEYWINRHSTVETIKELKVRFPESYVMILTDKEMKETEYEELMTAGVDDCFSKPFSSRKILLHLEKGLKRRRDILQRRGSADEFNRSEPINELSGETPIAGKMALSKASPF